MTATGPADRRRDPATPDDLFAHLEQLEIPVRTLEHPPVFTVAESRALRGELAGGHSKNLFLRNKKGAMWLLVCGESRTVDLKRLAELLGSGRLSFASPERLQRHLGVIPGAVTPFAVINDLEARVTVVLERDLLEHPVLHFHPLDNARTTAIAPDGLLRFLESVDHPPKLIALD